MNPKKCLHDYKEIFREEYTQVIHEEFIEVSSYGSKRTETIPGYREEVIHRWWIEQCRKCNVCRGKTPGNKYYALTKDRAYDIIHNDYENFIANEAINALSGLGE